MKFPLRASVLLFALSAFLPGARGQDASSTAPPPGQVQGMGGAITEHSVRGTVTAITGDNITVKTETGDVYKVETGPNTRFRKQRDQIKISDIHVGDMIGAAGDKDEKAKTLGAMFVMLIDKEQYEKARADFGKTWTAGADSIHRRDENHDQAPRQRNPDHRRRRKYLLPQAPRQHYAGGHQGWRQRHSSRLRPERKLPRHRIRCWWSRRKGWPRRLRKWWRKPRPAQSLTCSTKPVACSLYVASPHHDLASALRVATGHDGLSPRPAGRLAHPHITDTARRTVPARNGSAARHSPANRRRHPWLGQVGTHPSSWRQHHRHQHTHRPQVLDCH